MAKLASRQLTTTECSTLPPPRDWRNERCDGSSPRLVRTYRRPIALAHAGGCLHSGVDNFLLPRFVAASMVIYTHSHALSGMRKVDIFVHAGWDTNAGGIAVDMFFCISGFLVTGSFMRWPT